MSRLSVQLRCQLLPFAGKHAIAPPLQQSYLIAETCRRHQESASDGSHQVAGGIKGSSHHFCILLLPGSFAHRDLESKPNVEGTMEGDAGTNQIE